jgi:membrane protease YdiL (CAAX protease family)
MTTQSQASPALRPAAAAARPGLDFKHLAAFFALTFVLGWGAGALFVIFPDQVTALFGEMSYTNPLFILAVYSPAFAGLFLVWRHHGLRGLGRLLRRLTLWRMPAAWWALLVVGLPAAYYLGALLKGTLGEPFPFSPWTGVLPALAIALVIGPIEEFGWRGVALPLLQRRLAPLWAGLILGAIWGVWHVPAFFLSGTPQSAWALGPYLVGVLAVSVILTPMFNAARGSLLAAALFHFQLNGPAWPDAQPWDMYLFAALAVVVVILNRRTLLSRDGAVTEVLLGE